MKWIPALAIALLAAACTQNPHDVPLAELDLANPAVIEKVKASLDPDERSPFSTYVQIHWPGSARFCGEALVTKDNQLPTTVGEAIALTRVREEQLRRAREAATQPRTRQQQWNDRRAELLSRGDVLRDRLTLLVSEHGSAARKLPEWAEIEHELAANSKALAEHGIAPPQN